jgi:hypothetical protein
VIRLTRNLNFRFSALAACLLFFLTGSAFVSRLGIQNDEALFANGIFKPYAVAYKYPWGRAGLPLMLMSYLGTLKSWLYRPIFQWFGVGVSVVRLPMLLAGAASVWLFYRLLRRAAGERAALLGCGLQHLLILSGKLHFINRIRGFFDGDVVPVSEPGGQFRLPGFQHRFVFVDFGLSHGFHLLLSRSFCLFICCL